MKKKYLKLEIDSLKAERELLYKEIAELEYLAGFSDARIERFVRPPKVNLAVEGAASVIDLEQVEGAL